jgi:hypothetical protein
MCLLVNVLNPSDLVDLVCNESCWWQHKLFYLNIVSHFTTRWLWFSLFFFMCVINRIHCGIFKMWVWNSRVSSVAIDYFRNLIYGFGSEVVEFCDKYSSCPCFVFVLQIHNMKGCIQRLYLCYFNLVYSRRKKDKVCYSVKGNSMNVPGLEACLTNL